MQVFIVAHSYSCTCMQKRICMKCPRTSHVECEQFLNPRQCMGLLRDRSFLRLLLPSACYAGHMVARVIVFGEIPRLTVTCTVPLTR